MGIKKRIRTFVFLIVSIWLIGVKCGKMPLPFPGMLTGSIRIVAMDTLAVDSVRVSLDDMDMGRFVNPCVLENIVVGTHKLFVVDNTGASWSNLIDVVRDETIGYTFWLQTIGPNVGNTAPEFAAIDIQDNPISSESLQGRVVLLAFFEHT